MSKSNHARYASRTDRIDRLANRRTRRPARREGTRAAVIAHAVKEG